MKAEQIDFDVCIIGGGISGIAAANNLSKQSKLAWVLLQASGRLGGRINSINFDGKRVDTGAYQLASYQSSKQQNPLFQMIDKGFCQLDFRQNLNTVYYYDQTGAQFTNTTLQRIHKKIENLCSNVKQWTKKQKHLSANQCLDRFIDLGHLDQFSDSEKRLFELVIQMDAQQQATDLQNLQAQYFFVGDESQEDCIIDSYPLPSITYHGLVQRIIQNTKIANNNIKLNSIVTKVRKLQNHVEIHFSQSNSQNVQSKVLRVRKVICAVPLSVLKNNAILFQPQIPQSHSRLIQNIGYGYMQKIILAFQQPFWPENAQRLKIASKNKAKFLHFSNLSGFKQSSNQSTYILCCYVTGKYAQNLLKNYSNSQIMKLMTQFLQSVFKQKKIKIKDYYITNWMSQKFIEGSFSYVNPNLKFQQVLQIRKPIDNWLWFVGQYCYPENMGCAHGAFQTGYSAAQQIIKLQNKDRQ